MSIFEKLFGHFMFWWFSAYMCYLTYVFFDLQITELTR